MRQRRTGKEALHARVVPGKQPEPPEQPKVHAKCDNCGSTVCGPECFDDDGDIETVSEAGDYDPMDLEQSVAEQLSVLCFEPPEEFTVADQVELDSPGFKSEALKEFEKRWWWRKNRWTKLNERTR